MIKKIWIWNHYATNMFYDQAGRHYSFAENLINQGYEVTIFCASTLHFSKENIDTNGKKFILNKVNGIPFVFVKTCDYTGNSIQRLKNMFYFYKNMFPVSKEILKEIERPDIIIASSVHPLTLVAGIKIARKFKIPCICEVRDLWPESIVAYGLLKKDSVLVKILYKGEKWIYKNADSIIMTWPGGKQYIIDKKWENKIDLDKIEYISNGIDIEKFDFKSEYFIAHDIDLGNMNYKNVVYAGSIRKVNNIGILLDSAKIIQDKGYKDIRFLIYGSGDELEELNNRCIYEQIDNIRLKGKVEKKYIPYILKKSYINILHNRSTTLDKYGQSQNKLFEYLAAGRAIVQTYKTAYSIFEDNNCGVMTSVQTPEEIAEEIIKICENNNYYINENARKVAYNFDFKELTKKLVNMIERLDTGEI